MQSVCKNCKYFYALPESESGQCRRYPPKLVIVGTGLQPEQLRDVFVYVSSGSGCGEFVPFQNG